MVDVELEELIGANLDPWAAPSRCSCPISAPTGPTLASTCGGNAFMLFMGLLEVFIRSQCDIEDPCERINERLRTEPDVDYDFIVIGSGSGGSVVASRLVEVQAWKVLLIEAGNDEPVGTQIPSMFLNYIGSDIDWGYRTEPEKKACLSSKEQRCYWPRGKVLGGTSVINGMMYIRGNKEDFNEWADLDNPGWSNKHVLPFFLKSEHNMQIYEHNFAYHAFGGPLPISRFPYNPPMSYAILEGIKEMGYWVNDLNGANSTGFMIAQTTSKNGIRYSASRAFLRPKRKYTNLHILLNTTATRVLIDSTTKTAVGVDVIDRYGSHRRIMARKEVIVSGGAVNSPQILLLSGIGPKDELKEIGIKTIQDLPGVGKNLHNHVSFALNFIVNEIDTAPLNWATAMEYLLYRDGLMSGTGISDVTGKISSRYADNPDSPDIQFYFGGYLASCSSTGQVGELVTNNSRTIQIYPTVLQPKSRGYLKLASTDPLQHPRIYANYLTNDHDIRVLIEGIKFAIRFSKTESMQRYGMQLDRTPTAGCESHSFGSDAYWECAIRQDTGPENHQAGSCKMGPYTDPMAVVDHELRVHGIRSLRVVDASVMPKVTSGNTHAPVVMIAEKASYLIKKAWGYSEPYPGKNRFGAVF